MLHISRFFVSLLLISEVALHTILPGTSVRAGVLGQTAFDYEVVAVLPCVGWVGRITTFDVGVDRQACTFTS